MPIYKYGKGTIRKDGRVCCCVEGKVQYRSRLAYCNHHEVRLEDIKGMHVHHIDGDRTNDNPCNLELLTHKDHNRKHPGKAKGERSIEFKRQCSESMKKRWSEGFYKNKKGRKRSYSNEIVIEILRAITEDKESRVSIARRLKMPRSSVQNIIYGELRNVSNVCI